MSLCPSLAMWVPYKSLWRVYELDSKESKIQDQMTDLMQ